MSTVFDPGRRRFFRAVQSTLAASAATAFIPQLHMIGNAVAAAPGDGYKALVCVFLLGGNDSFNMLIPHVKEEYDIYRLSRGGIHDPRSNRHGLAIAHEQLLPLLDRNGKSWGLHPACPEMKSLFDAGDLAFLANVGTLRRPLAKADLQHDKRLLPENLFSHADQQRLWMRGHSQASTSAFGWGGLCVDRLSLINVDAPTALPPTISLSGGNQFQNGASTSAYVMTATGTLNPLGFTTRNKADRTRREALHALLARKRAPIMQEHYGVLGESALRSSEEMRAILSPENDGDIAAPLPNANPLAAQLRMIARMIKAGRRGKLGHSRQIYYVGMSGFDTHDKQAGDGGRHARLLARLSEALATFHADLGHIGALNDVVTFTMSEFGRTLDSNGNGSDHGWGGVQLIMAGNADRGGPLRGKMVHGDYPLLELDGAQSIGRGRMIPTTSTDQMAATLARWIGVATSELGAIFPGLSQFDRPTIDFLA